MSSIILTLILLFLLGLGVPIGVSLALSAAVGIVFFTSVPAIVIVQQYLVSIDNFVLVAIPLFILAGNVMSAGDVSIRLVNMAKALVGHLPGGLAATCVVTCLIFGAMTGSSAGTIFAIGAILIPEMVRRGYPVGFASALQATSAELAVIIPPSIPLILYGVTTNTSIGDLFLAGFMPGIFIAAVLVALVVAWSMIRGYGMSMDPIRLRDALVHGRLTLLLPVIIMGGIYGGIFTPTEAAVAAVAYALFLAGPVYRKLSVSGMGRILAKSSVATSFIMFTYAAAGLFSYVLEVLGGGIALAGWISSTFTSPWSFLLAVNLLLLVAGMVVEPPVGIIIFAPLLAPTAIVLGIDPIHFGLIMAVNLAIGMITPPVGINLYAACAVGETSMEKMMPYLVPFIIAGVLCLGVITYVPAISVGILGLLK